MKPKFNGGANYRKLILKVNTSNFGFGQVGPKSGTFQFHTVMGFLKGESYAQMWSTLVARDKESIDGGAGLVVDTIRDQLVLPTDNFSFDLSTTFLQHLNWNDLKAEAKI